MKQIQIYSGARKSIRQPIPNTFAIVDDQDYELIINFCDPTRWSLFEGYAVKNTSADDDNKQIFMQHLILPRKEGYKVDHIDRVKLHNSRNNLRYATSNLQCVNIIKPNPNGFRGVVYRSNKYGASVRNYGKRIWLGTYDTAEAAARAYDKALKEIYPGEILPLNFPNE